MAKVALLAPNSSNGQAYKNWANCRQFYSYFIRFNRPSLARRRQAGRSRMVGRCRCADMNTGPSTTLGSRRAAHWLRD